MNPDNNSLKRTYFIGGPPRVGKSILAHKLAKRIGGHVVSTDAIRNAVKKHIENPDSDIFLGNKNNDLSEKELIDQYQNNPKKTIHIQNRESKFLWSGIMGFCNAFCEDNENHILEGVAILPELVSKMKHRPDTVIFVGNTNPGHSEQILKFSKKYPEWDWLSSLSYSDEKITSFSNFVTHMSEFFKSEAKKYGYKYFELPDSRFEQEIDKIVDMLANTDDKNTSTKTDKSMPITEAKLYTDGGSRGNPGHSASAYVIQDMGGNELESSGLYIGITTNNQAEYQALRRGMERLLEMNVKKAHIFMDSLLVVNQMKGQYKVKNRDLWPIYESLVELSKKFQEIKFNHVPREINKKADAEVNRILDEHLANN